MATSGDTSWTFNRDQVVTASLRKLSVLPSGASPTTAQFNDAVDALQALVKILAADGLPLWKIATQSFVTVSGTADYTVGPSQTINCPQPIRILQALITQSGGSTIPLDMMTRYDFNELPHATTITGSPVSFYYQPLRTTGTISLWPIPNDSTTTITFHYQSPFEDMDSSTNEFDFPSSWIQPLIYLLAWSLCPEYGIPTADRMALQKEAEYWHQYALSLGGEEGSVFFRPNDQMK